MKVFLEEELSDFLRNYLTQASVSHTICSSNLLETECRRAAHREGIAQSSISAALENVRLISASDEILHHAGMMLPNGDEFLRSLDAIHLATAQSCAADLFITYDEKQFEAARALGFNAASPGKK
ncbi:ribonuclease VapC [Spirochaetia bacterium]|nr:ribonuclease VapC [Spirochaetia bacterium]